MRPLLYLLIAGAASVGTASADQGRGQAKNRGDVVVRSATSAPAISVSVVFAPRDITVIRTHYASRYRNLPPGLQKKLARGGTLPPGWQKKMEPFPPALDRDLVVLPGGYRRGVIEGHAVIYHPITHAILDIASLF
jgi:hypothetical protein